MISHIIYLVAKETGSEEVLVRVLPEFHGRVTSSHASIGIVCGCHMYHVPGIWFAATDMSSVSAHGLRSLPVCAKHKVGRWFLCQQRQDS